LPPRGSLNKAERLAKYIPGEVVAAYLSMTNIVGQRAGWAESSDCDTPG
jgi:hypothetical protein